MKDLPSYLQKKIGFPIQRHSKKLVGTQIKLRRVHSALFFGKALAEKNSYFSFAVHCFDMEERNKEIQEIEGAYNSGKLAEFESTIGEIIDAKGAEILAFYDKLSKKHRDATVSGALKIYILMHKSLNIKIENTAQTTEMEKEIWYLGEKLHRDPTQEEKQTTCREWCKKFAAPYRIHQIGRAHV
jgi:hypothetical protein